MDNEQQDWNLTKAALKHTLEKMAASAGPCCSNGDRATAPSSDLSFDWQSSLAELEERRRILGMEKRQVEDAIPKIQRVQPYLRNREDFATKYYSPKVISIGPIHCGDRENLKEGERYKMMWAAMYLEDTNQTAESLFEIIRTNLPKLKELYAEDAIKGFDKKEEELAWMFLLDGCAVLGFLRRVTKQPETNLKIKIDQLVLVEHDLLLLENQLPYKLLTLLSKGGEAELNGCVEKFLEKHPMTRITGASKPSGDKHLNITMDQPPHLLHRLRQNILVDPEYISKEGIGLEHQSYRNIQELKAAGITVRKGNDRKLTDISFDWRMTRWGFGRLSLSKLTVDDLMLPTFLNLIAYEMCPDFKNGYGISSYVAFLDSLIDHPDDVKHLRKAGVLHNLLGSDEDVAKLFNIISSDLMPDTDTYREIRRKLEERYNTRWMTWIAQARHDHFSSPWAVLGFAAACIALFLTFVQTWLALHPPNSDALPPPPRA